MAYGMDELHPACVEGDGTVGVAAPCPVLEVAPDGAANISQLAAYLVVATGLQRDLEEAVALARAYDPVVQLCPLGARHLAVVCVRLVLPLVAHEPVDERALGLLWLAGDDCPVRLVYAAFGEHLVEPGQRLARTRKKDCAAYGAVEPVNNTKEDVAGLGIRFLDVLLYCLAERSVAGLVALDYLPALLRDDDDVVVFVEDVHGCVGATMCVWLTCSCRRQSV